MKAILLTLLLAFSQTWVLAQKSSPQLMIPTGHPQGIVQLKLLPKENMLASRSYNDKSIRLWDTRTGKLLRLVNFAETPVLLDASQQGKKLLVYINDSTTFIHDYLQQKNLLTIHEPFINAFFTANSKHVIYYAPKKLQRLNAQTGKPERTAILKDPIQNVVRLPKDTGFIVVSRSISKTYCDVFNKDMVFVKRLLTINDTAVIQVLPFNSHIGIFNFTGNMYTKYSFNYSYKQLATHVEDSIYGKPKTFAYSAKGTVAFAMDDTTIQVVDAKGKWKHALSNYPNGISSIAFINNGKYLLVRNAFELICINAADGRELKQYDYDRTIIDLKNVEAAICVNETDNRFYFVLTDNFINEAYIDGDSLVVSKKIKGLTETINHSLVGSNTLSFVTAKGHLKQLNLGNASMENASSIHANYIGSFSQNDSFYITASWDSTLKVWSRKGNANILQKKTGDWVTDCSISPNNWVTYITGNFIYQDTGYSIKACMFNLDEPSVETCASFSKRVVSPISNNGQQLFFATQEDSLIHICYKDFAEIRTIKSKGWLLSLQAYPSLNRIVAQTLTHLEVYDSSFSLLKTIEHNNSNGSGGFDINSTGTAFLIGKENGQLDYLFKNESKTLSALATTAGIAPKFINDSTCATLSENGTIKLWDIRPNGLFEKCLVVPFDSTDYVTLIPTGYYQATKSGASSLHYVTSNLKVVNFDQLDIKYNRPDKVLQYIGNKDTALINSYKKAYEKRIKKLGIDTAQFVDGFSVPDADISNRNQIATAQNTGKLFLKIKAADNSYALQQWNVWVNGVPLFGLTGKRIKQINAFDTTLPIVLSQGDNRIETSVTNINGTESYRMPLFVKYTPAVLKQAKLHFIGIGINQFANPDYNLNWSVKDIRDLAVKLKDKYPGIIIDTLFDNNVTKEKIIALKQKLLLLNEDDKVIVSYSGHGVLSKELDYYLSTYSINFNKPEENGLAYDDLESLMDNIKPRQKLMLIDACHSGEVDKDEIAKIETSKKILDSSGITHKSTIKVVAKKNIGMANSFELMQNLFVNVGKGTGATIISAAGGMQYAQERGDLKNGVFTYSIIEAFNKNATLKVSELKKIVGARVMQLTNGLQKPTSRNETNSYDWIIW